jgi:hypothetical protein
MVRLTSAGSVGVSVRIGVVLIVACVVALSGPPRSVAADGMATVATDALNLRAEPSADAAILDVLGLGTTLEVWWGPVDGGWYEVYDPLTGLQGWVAGEYLRIGGASGYGGDQASASWSEPERWIDVDLSAQRVRAVVGRKVVHTAVMSSGKQKWETPTGTFYINRRVENETMTSESIGAEDNYRLENVLYTQYFTDEGHALHYSWWKEPGSFGIPTSHGCVSMQLKDSEFFWNFARVGTRVFIQGRAPVR